MKLFKHKKRKRNIQETEELDITSLLDILVVLLIFLLQSFSASELDVHLVDELSLPYSYSKFMGRNGVVLQVNSQRKIWVNQKHFGDLTQDETTDTNLLKELEILAKEERQKINLKNPVDEKIPLFINLVLDKELKYEDVQIVMQTAAMAGFGKYKFIVQGNE